MSTALISPTVQSVLNSVRLMLRQTDPNNSNWTDEELLLHINEGARVFSAELGLINEGHSTSQDDLDIVSGSATIALPTDCFQVKNLWRKQGTGYIMLAYKNNLTADLETSPSGSGQGFLPSYNFRGNNLILSQVPGFSETDGLRIEYSQYPSILVDGSDQLTAQISPIFWQVIPAYAVYKAKLAESLVTGVVTYGPIKEHLNELAEQFRRANVKRSKNPVYVDPFDA